MYTYVLIQSYRQYYVYVTDTRCKRVGTQCWVLGAITATETIICAKFGRSLLGQAQIQNIGLWLLIQVFLSVGCVTGCIIRETVNKKNNRVANIAKKAS